MHIVDFHSQFIAKLETKLGQLAITVGKREEGKILSHPVHSRRGQQFEQLKAIMVLRNGKAIENKVSEKEHDKEERLKTMESDLEIKRENDPTPSHVMSNTTMTYKPRVPYP